MPLRNNFTSVRLEGLTRLIVGGQSDSLDGITEIHVSVVAQPEAGQPVPDDTAFFQGTVTERPITTGWTADITIEPGDLVHKQQVLLAGVALGSPPADPVMVWSGTFPIKTKDEK